jgi:hypothetical protein
MFIYAFARELSKRKNQPYCLSKIGKLRYFELTPLERLLNTLKFLFFKFNEKILRNASRHFLKDQSKHYYDHVLALQGNLVLDGYFQGEDYFKNVAANIRKAFRIRPTFKRIFNQHVAHAFSQKVIAVHVRRTDYHHAFQDLGIGTGSFALPEHYYNNALAQIKDLDNFRVIFISDDIAFVKQHFSHIKNSTFSNFDEITDLQILMHADVLILSSSSFSWWGAWLNEKPHKKIFIPKYYLGYKVGRTFPVNIIPPDWEQVEFISQQ